MLPKIYDHRKGATSIHASWFDQNAEAPPGNSGGGKNNTDLLFAYVRAATLFQSSTAAAGAVSLFDSIADDIFDRDEGHVDLQGVAAFALAPAATWGAPVRGRLADALMRSRSEESRKRLAVYRRSLFLEPRLYGGAIGNTIAGVAYRAHVDGELDSEAIREVENAIAVLDPRTFRVKSGERVGWLETPDGVDFLFLDLRYDYWPSSGRWHVIPWQIWSELPYALLEAAPWVGYEARMTIGRILRRLRRSARLVTSGFTKFGPNDEGKPLPIIDAKTLALIPIEESGAERTYSWRWLDSRARPATGAFSLERRALPLKPRAIEWFRGEQG